MQHPLTVPKPLVEPATPARPARNIPWKARRRRWRSSESCRTVACRSGWPRKRVTSRPRDLDPPTFTTGHGVAPWPGTGGAAVQSAKGAPGTGDPRRLRVLRGGSRLRGQLRLPLGGQHGRRSQPRPDVRGTRTSSVLPPSWCPPVPPSERCQTWPGWRSAWATTPGAISRPCKPRAVLPGRGDQAVLHRWSLRPVGPAGGGEGPSPANLFDQGDVRRRATGCRRILDTTFMMGFLVRADSDRGEVEQYFRAVAAPAGHRRRAGALQALSPEGTAGALPHAGGRPGPWPRRAHGL